MKDVYFVSSRLESRESGACTPLPCSEFLIVFFFRFSLFFVLFFYPSFLIVMCVFLQKNNLPVLSVQQDVYVQTSRPCFIKIVLEVSIVLLDLGFLFSVQ